MDKESLSGGETELGIVLSVLEGRDFPDSKDDVRISAVIRGVEQCTDLVHGSRAPQFFTDLSWDTDKSVYHTLRSNKDPIRVTAVYGATNKKIGHFVLDLKEAFPLPPGTCPEDFIQQRAKWSRLIGTKKDIKQAGHPSILWLLTINSHSSLTPHQKDSAVSKNFEEIHPVLDEVGGYFVIGSNPFQEFHFSFEINSATNLQAVLDNRGTTISFEEFNEYYFSYTLFNEPLMTDPFRDIATSSINVEEVVIKIHSSLEDVVHYFSQLRPIRVSLFGGKKELDWVEIKISDLVELSVDQLEHSPLSCDSVFPLKNSLNSFIRIYFCIEYIGEIQKIQKSITIEDGIDKSDFETASTPKQLKRRSLTKSSSEESEVTYRFTVNLKFLKLDMSSTKTVRLRYTYPSLIEDKEVDSFDFEISSGEKVTVPYGTCQFAFKAEPSTFLKILRKHILVVNVLDVDNNYKAFAYCNLDLSQVLTVPPSTDSIKEINVSSTVFSKIGNQRKMGSLICCLTLFVDNTDNHGSPASKLKKTDREPSNHRLNKKGEEETNEWKKRQRHVIKELNQIKQNFKDSLEAEWKNTEKSLEISNQSQLNRINELEKSLRNSVNNCEASISSLEEKDKKVARFQQVNARLTAKSDKLEKQIKELEKTNEDITKSTRAQFSREIADKDRRIRELEAKNANYFSQIKRLETELVKKDKELLEQKHDKKIIELEARLRSLLDEKEKERDEKGQLQDALGNLLSFLKKDPFTFSSESEPTKSNSKKTVCAEEIKKEIERLTREKSSILRAGEYTENDRLISQITEKINSLSKGPPYS